MKVGCGLVAKKVNGRRYIYFWRYSENGGRSRKVERYAGPVDSPEAKAKAIVMLLEHQERARAELDARIGRYRRAIDRLRHS